MRKRPVIVVSAIGVVAVVILVFFNPFASNPRLPAASHVKGGFTAAQSAPVASGAIAALGRLTSDPSSLVPSDQAGNIDPQVAIPPGSTLVADETTWISASSTSGTLDVILKSPGLPDQKYLVSMALMNRTWKVLLTVPLGPGK